MPLILVVEQDESRRDRILETLRRDGLSIETATSRAEALRRAEKCAPGLLVTSSAIPEATALLADFSRHRGGPGALVLIDDPDESSAADYPADEILAVPFSDDQLLKLVQGLLSSAPSRSSGPMSSSAAEQLTSEDIFGDVLAEVEAGAPDSRSTDRKSAMPMAEIERRLEETLSGVIPTGRDRRPGGERSPEPRGKARKRRPELPDTEIDDLLDQTLSSLDIPTRSRRSSTSGARPDTSSEADAPASAPALAESERPAESAADPGPPESGPELTWSAPALEPPEDGATADAPVEDAGTGSGFAAPPPPGAVPAGVTGVARGADVFRTQPLPVILPNTHADAEPESEGDAFGDYTLLDRIAVGGMAEVWRARRRGVEGFQKTVAIKKILSNLTGSKDFVTMFIDEAKLAAQLSHNNIIQIYDLGKVGDDFFIAMEHVDGKDLRTILTAAQESKQPIPLGLALVIVSAVASALDYAHRKRDFDGDAMGLVHRDVSPQNVMISYEGSIKLCDFGIVKAVAKASTTQMGALKGKLQYMSPEQAWGKNVDARSDIFSLGSVFYEVLTGRQLFAGDSEIGVLDAVRECQIRSPREIEPAVPEEVARIALKALAKSPDERYQRAGDLEHDIRKVLDDLRPTPSQKTLAEYMRSLFETSMSGAVPLASAGAAAAPSSQAPGSAVISPEPVVAGPPGTAEPAADPPVAAEEPTDQPVAPEEASSGRWKWLAAAVVTTVLVGLGLLVVPSLVRREAPPSSTSSPPPPTPGAAAVQVPADPLPAVRSAPLEDTATATQDDPTDELAAPEPAEKLAPGSADQEPDEPESAVTAAGVDIEQLVNEELSSRTEQLRLELEAEKKRLERELARAQAENETTEADGNDGGGGQDGAPGDEGSEAGGAGGS